MGKNIKILIGFVLLLTIASCKFKNYPNYQYNNPYDPLSPNFDDALIKGDWNEIDFKHIWYDGKIYNIYPAVCIIKNEEDPELYLFGGLYQGFEFGGVANISISGDTTYQFNVMPALMTERKWCTVNNINDYFFVFGGDSESTYEIHNFIVDSIKVKKLPNITLTYGSASVAIEKNIILVGGESAKGVKDKYLWLFNPSLLYWSILDTLPQPLSFASTLIMNKKLYIIGGFLNNDMPSDKIYIYDLENHVWNEFPVSLPVGGRPALAAWKEKVRIYCMGGFFNKNYYINIRHDNYEIDLKQNRILKKKSIPNNIEFVYKAFWLNSKIYVLAKEKYPILFKDYFNIYTFKLTYFSE